MSPSRMAEGGTHVDRTRPLHFSFDGTTHVGYAGDTLASALLANGVRIVARGISSGRPRGIFSAGAEEPNAYVQATLNGASEPMLRATQLELFEGLEARGLSGVGRLVDGPDPARVEKIFAHCEVLVVGAGPSGLAAAVAAGRSGARVILVEEDCALGGGLLGSRGRSIDGQPALDWVAARQAELASLPEVRVLRRTTAFGSYDDNLVMLAERCADSASRVYQRLWQVRTRQVVLASGAHERSLVFANNDRPGVMLAGAARTYVNRFGVAPGDRAVVFTTNDSAYEAALDLLESGVAVAAVVDARAEAGRARRRVEARGIPILSEHVVVDTEADGEGRLTGVRVAPWQGDGPTRAVECDLLAVSGGFNPVVHLHSQRVGRLRFDDRLGCFIPAGAVRDQQVVGAAAGVFGLGAAIHQGSAAGAEAAMQAGFGGGTPPTPSVVEEDAPVPPRPLWLLPSPSGTWDRHFVDLQRDATVADLERGLKAGLHSVEHLKRYTTIGTGSDQGKTANVLAIGVASALLGESAEAIGTTTFRPPYTPVAFGLLAGRQRGNLLDPVRVTPIHSWHVAQGAVFEDVGQWKRPWYFPRAGEDMEAAVLRECRSAREAVGVIDASTLGKIEVQGPDAAELLNRLYTNAYDTLAVGSIRYGMLCRADGMVFDDGVVMRLAQDRFLTSTTTGNAAEVLEWMEEWLQTEWPDLRVRLTSVTDHWATIAVVGPRARDVLRVLAPGMDLSREAFPFMTLQEGVVAGVQARVCRVTFSGELAYEINVPAWYGLGVWEAVMEAGRPFRITPYGTETMHVLRAEKGFIIVGQDTDGTVTPIDLGMEWIVSRKKPDFVGKRSLTRADTARPDRKQLVGLLPIDPGARLPEGGQLVWDPEQAVPMTMVGHVTSSYRSAALGRTFALALLREGRSRVGGTVYAPLPEGVVAATVTEPIFYDRENARRDG